MGGLQEWEGKEDLQECEGKEDLQEAAGVGEAVSATLSRSACTPGCTASSRPSSRGQPRCDQQRCRGRQTL